MENLVYAEILFISLKSKPIVSQIDGSSALIRISLYGQGVLP